MTIQVHTWSEAARAACVNVINETQISPHLASPASAVASPAPSRSRAVRASWTDRRTMAISIDRPHISE